MPISLVNLLAGDNMIGGEAFCDEVYNNLKNLFRAAPDVVCVDNEVVCVGNEVVTLNA